MISERNEAYRRARLRKTMDEARLDGFLIVDPLNVSYLTGFRGDDSYLWVGDVGAVLLSDTRFEEQIKEEAPDLDALIRRSGETTLGLLTAAVADSRYSSASPKRVGIEAASTTVSLFNSLREKFPDVEFVPRANDVERLREIKDASEIAAIRAAVEVTIDGFRALKSAILPDATEVDLRDELEYRMRKAGGDDVAFPTIVAFDDRAALPHAIPGRGRKVGESSLILIDWGAKKDAYVGDLTRTFRTERGMNAASESAFARKFREVYDVVLAAHDAAIAAMKPGVRCDEIDGIARKTIADAGFGDFFGHGLGHGIGRFVHDFGGLNPRAERLLEPGMILTVEPGIYLPGWGGVRTEDDVLVTETGVEILSQRLSTDDAELF